MKIDGNGRGLGIGVFGPVSDSIRRGPRLEPVGRPFREAQPPKPQVDRLPAQPPINVEEGSTYKPRTITGKPIRLPVKEVSPEDIVPIKGKGTVSIDPVPLPVVQVDPGDVNPIKSRITAQIDPPQPVPVIQVTPEGGPTVVGDDLPEPLPVVKYQGDGGGVTAKPDPETTPIDRTVDLA
jgi:hypothetical protein